MWALLCGEALDHKYGPSATNSRPAAYLDHKVTYCLAGVSKYLWVFALLVYEADARLARRAY